MYERTHESCDSMYERTHVSCDNVYVSTHESCKCLSTHESCYKYAQSSGAKQIYLVIYNTMALHRNYA